MPSPYSAALSTEAVCELMSVLKVLKQGALAAGHHTKSITRTPSAVCDLWHSLCDRTRQRPRLVVHPLREPRSSLLRYHATTPPPGMAKYTAGSAQDGPRPLRVARKMSPPRQIQAEAGTAAVWVVAVTAAVQRCSVVWAWS